MGLETLITIAGVSGIIFFLHRIQREIGGISTKLDIVATQQTDHEGRLRILEGERK